MKLSSNILRLFTVEGDVVAWFNKLKLVVKLLKIEDRATLILMYLEGNVLAVYLEMGRKTSLMLRASRRDSRWHFLRIPSKPISN